MKDFKCMLAHKFEEKRVKLPCLVSPKLDGIRAVFYKGKFYTRNKNQVKGLNHLEEALAEIPDTLDGELLIPGLTFQESSGKIRSFNDTPEAHFYVFDAPCEHDQQDRLFKLSRLVNSIRHTQVSAVPHTLITDLPQIYTLYKAYRCQGYEGAMVKTLEGAYTNSRSYSWLKMKEVETYDVVCVDFFRGQGRLDSTLGGIIVELDGVEIRVGSGFSDLDRDHIWHNRSAFLGRVCEIAGQELTPDGSLRHPRFITWRDDIDNAS